MGYSAKCVTFARLIVGSVRLFAVFLGGGWLQKSTNSTFMLGLNCISCLLECR